MSCYSESQSGNEQCGHNTRTFSRGTTPKILIQFYFDFSGLSTTKNFTIIVRNQNDPPTGISVSSPLKVPENSLSGKYIGTVTTADQDDGQTHHYTIVDVVGQGYDGQRYELVILAWSILVASESITRYEFKNWSWEKITNTEVLITATEFNLAHFCWFQFRLRMIVYQF